MRLLRGRSTPAIRATSPPLLSLALLVTRVAALDTHHTAAPDYLALPADRLDGCADLHGVRASSGYTGRRPSPQRSARSAPTASRRGSLPSSRPPSRRPPARRHSPSARWRAPCP